MPPVSGGTPSNLKRMVKRSVPAGIAGRVVAERTRGIRRALGRRESGMGSTHANMDTTDSVDYIDTVFDDYLRYGGVDRAELAGMDVLELGPGDNFGVALRFLAAGASSVVAADRFIPVRDHELHRRIYEGLLDRLSAEERQRIGSIASGAEISLDGVGLEILEEAPIEEVPGIVGDRRFDMIVSRAVLEHVFDLDTAFDSMAKLLKPGGRMIHKVDLRDHGLFTEGGHNALTFLTIDDRVYRLMGERTAGLPNRKLLGWYQRKLDGLGFEAEYLVTHLAGVDAEVLPHTPFEDGLPDPAPLAGVEEIRPRLRARYRDLPAELLAVSGFMLIARAPAAE